MKITDILNESRAAKFDEIEQIIRQRNMTFSQVENLLWKKFEVDAHLEYVGDGEPEGEPTIVQGGMSTDGKRRLRLSYTGYIHPRETPFADIKQGFFLLRHELGHNFQNVTDGDPGPKNNEKSLIGEFDYLTGKYESSQRIADTAHMLSSLDMVPEDMITLINSTVERGVSKDGSTSKAVRDALNSKVMNSGSGDTSELAVATLANTILVFAKMRIDGDKERTKKYKSFMRSVSKQFTKVSAYQRKNRN